MFSRDALLDRLHADQRAATDRAVGGHVKNLRRKPEQAGGKSDCTRSIHGVGYRFDGPAKPNPRNGLFQGVWVQAVASRLPELPGASYPMFGRPKSVTFEPYGRRRPRGRPPGWLVLLLVGVVAGAGGVVFVQEHYLPSRLSPAASAELRSELTTANTARTSFGSQLAQTSQRLAATLVERTKLADTVAASRLTLDGLRDDLAAVIDTLPADPRGGAVEIRAARLTAKGGTLAYDLVLTHERRAAKPLAAAVRFGIAGETGRGVPGNLSAPPIATTIGARLVLRGSIALPAGFSARQATVQIVDSAGRTLGMRVLLVR